MIILTTIQSGLPFPVVPMSRPQREGSYSPIIVLGLTDPYAHASSVMVSLSGPIVFKSRNGRPALVQPSFQQAERIQQFIDTNKSVLISFYEREIDYKTLLDQIIPV